MGHAILQHGLIDASATLVVGGGRMIGTVLDIQKGASAKASTELLRTVLEMAILRSTAGTGGRPQQPPVAEAHREAQHPVANDLQTDAADPRRIRPAATIVDLGQRQQTTALGRVPGPLREAPQ